MLGEDRNMQIYVCIFRETGLVFPERSYFTGKGNGGVVSGPKSWPMLLIGKRIVAHVH